MSNFVGVVRAEFRKHAATAIVAVIFGLAASFGGLALQQVNNAAERFTVPDGMVAFFRTDDCPTDLGWHSYEAGVGKFIRAYDPNDGLDVEQTQKAAIGRHKHMTRVYRNTNAGGNNIRNLTLKDVDSDTTFLTTQERLEISSKEVEVAEEPRPRNITLRLCVKQ